MNDEKDMEFGSISVICEMGLR